MKSFAIRGVPLAMQRDGWWLESAPPKGTPKLKATEGSWTRPFMLVALIALGDMLLWDVTAGLSVAVFAIALVMGAIGAWHSNIAPQRLKMVAMGTLLSVLPVVELVQPLSLLVLTIGGIRHFGVSVRGAAAQVGPCVCAAVDGRPPTHD